MIPPSLFIGIPVSVIMFDAGIFCNFMVNKFSLLTFIRIRDNL